MIDFHTHILPGIDDGARNVEQSLALLREEARLGVTTVVLTPHYRAERHSPAQFLEKRTKALDTLTPHLEAGMPRLLPGAEVHYFEGMAAVQELDAMCIAGTDLLLLEMPMSRWSERMIGTILELNRTRFQVVLAHIERYLSMQPKQVLERLADSGVKFQVSVAFFSGWVDRRRAFQMMDHGYIHLLGSDCHNLSSRAPDWEKLPPRAAALHQTGEAILQRHSRKSHGQFGGQPAEL